MTLPEYLDHAAQTPFAWGAHDCATFPAGWVERATGLDPLEGVSGTYGNREEAEAVIAAAGGLLTLWEAGAVLVGSPRTSAPRRGDVGLVEIPALGGSLQLGAIRVDRAWAMLLSDGLIVRTARCLAAWRV
jgi:hypothetical protein